jgi:AcrR family transcriptional regulator
MPGPANEPAGKDRRSANDPRRSAEDARGAARDARRSAQELRTSVSQASAGVRDAARATRQAAGLSAVVASTTKEAVRQAVDEARRAMQDVKLEIRVERMTREESRQQTRERLLDAAAEVFNRLGYHGASLEAVAEAAGYTKGAVYSNFATKGELFAALLDRSSQERFAQQTEATDALTLTQLADAAGEMLHRQAREDETWDLLQVEFWLAAMRDPALRERMCEGSEELYREWGRRLDAKFAEAGVDAPFSGTDFARLINALGSGMLLQVSLEPNAIDPSLFTRAIRLLAGLPDERSEPTSAPVPTSGPAPPPAQAPPPAEGAPG